MKRRWTMLAAALALVALGAIAGTAFAVSRGVALNGHASASTVTPNFQSGTAVKVKAAAVVNSDATVARSSTLPYSVTSTTHLSAGVYDVRFSHAINGCAWLGTVGLAGFSGSSGDGTITITGRSGTNNGLFITTFNSAGTPTDLPFHVIVVC